MTLALESESGGRANRSLLGEKLLNAGLITATELESALAEQSVKKTRLGETLIELGLLDEDELLPFLQRDLQVPSVRLREGLIDPKAVGLLSREKAEALEALPLFCVRDVLTVAMAEPHNLRRLDELERLTGLTVRPVCALRPDIRRMTERCYEEGFEVDVVTADLGDDAIDLQSENFDIDTAKIEELAQGSPIIKLVNYMIVHAIRQGASDIHVEPGQHHSTVRFRIDGQLREMLRPRKDLHAAILSRIKVMARMDVAEHRLPQDGRLHVQAERREVDLRVSTLPTVLGEKAVLRVLDKQRVTFHLGQLGIPDDILGQMNRMLARPYGLILVTGPTGSGKTTTLYSALEVIKSVHHNIVTVEDPVEYRLDLINQVQVDNNASLTFAGVLRAILRQDPDVIMVGEIRDAETAEIAVQAALTGHLVLSTLHTNDAAGAVTRLLDMGVDAFKIAAALVGVIAQRLVRKVCPHCRIPYYPPVELLGSLHYSGDIRRQFVRGEGCPECFDTGFRGRIGLYEILSCDADMRKLIVGGSSAEALRHRHQEVGGRSLLQEGLRMAETEMTSLDEVMRVALFD